METALDQSLGGKRAVSSIQQILLGIPIYVYISVVASKLVILGILWDIAWHMSIGRDGLFSAPHVLIYIGAASAGLFSGFKVLKTSFWGNDREKNKMVNFWGIFYSSLGGLFCIWGGLAAITSAPFDDWWHNTYGLDVEIFSPPHTVLLLGLMSVQVGAMVSVLAFLNRKDTFYFLSASQAERRLKRLQWMFVFTAGFLVTTMFTALSEFLDRWQLHGVSYYQIASAAFPVLLLATARGSGMKWGATYIAATFMFFFWAVNATLRLLPAEPLLGPVHNRITTYQTLGFPILLIFPAIGLDLLRARLANVNDWFLALPLAFIYLLILVGFSYPFGNFILESPMARSWFWGSSSWSYQNSPDWEFRYKFTEWSSTKGLGNWASGLGIALLLSMLSTRIGLAWGKWMQKVQR
ncbi:hypothetical protein [Emticicia sp. 21SJ11W-3]|uniref:hypothetical protein n=1 Tax=Emticicia sp. 21SJ11W-3 TaxID=2916755 RepID=UPI0020A1A8FA|nr:hypothetical protein [Emticicia sp. 21SJ11W-3]UTA68348.1 hypothetical protein MB380_00750 [Emticicia sp. 21SJ11W-3]